MLESFTTAVLHSQDEIVRESFLESCVEVLRPRGGGDPLDNGRVSRAGQGEVWRGGRRAELGVVMDSSAWLVERRQCRTRCLRIIAVVLQTRKQTCCSLQLESAVQLLKMTLLLA